MVAGRYRSTYCSCILSICKAPPLLRFRWFNQKAFKQMPVIPSYRFIRDYYAHPSYNSALAERFVVIGRKMAERIWFALFHGIPKRLADEGDIYPQHCEALRIKLAR
ncbi:ferrochelatase [Vibrio chagasii]|nr:ferrochelatase [Vibrio chagasii]